VSALSAVVQPVLLNGVGGEGEEDAREQGAGECGASAAYTCNDVFCVGEPVCWAESERACGVGEDVHDDEGAPDGEADGMQGEQQSAAVSGDE
jgi:hypothetical protein